MSLRCWLRHQEMWPAMIDGLMTPKFKSIIERAEHEQKADPSTTRGRFVSDPNLSWQFKHVTYPMIMLEMVRACLDVVIDAKAMAPFHGSVEQSLKLLNMGHCNMERVQDTELPFAYI